MTDIEIIKAPAVDTTAVLDAVSTASAPTAASVAASAAASAATPAADRIPADSPVVTVYSVFGMNCGHCAGAVTRELSAIHGVTGVQVDLGAKKVTVGSTRPLSEDEVRAAVDEAGYELG